MVAKLSSVRIITAASLETSVPVMPMATPMSAVFSAGASLTPSPVIATTLPFSLSSRTRRTLSSGATRATTPISSSSASSCSSLIAANCGAGDRPALDAQLAGDRGGRRGVVAGDHPDPDPGVVALGDRGLGLGARRVDDADHRQQRELLDQVDQVAARRGTVPGSKSRCATTITRSPALAIWSLASRARCRLSSVIGDQGAVGVPDRRGARDEDVRGALDVAAHDRAAVVGGHLVEGRHELVVGVERHLGDPRQRRAGLVDVEPALRAQHDQRALGRVADQGSRRRARRRRTAPSAAGTGRGRGAGRRRG